MSEKIDRLFRHRSSVRRWPQRLVLWPSLIGAGVLLGALITPNGNPATATGPVLAVAPAAAATGAPPLQNGTAGNTASLSGGAMWYPWAPGPGELGANPMAFSVDHVLDDGRTAKKVVASWGRNEDSPTAPPLNTRAGR